MLRIQLQKFPALTCLARSINLHICGAVFTPARRIATLLRRSAAVINGVPRDDDVDLSWMGGGEGEVCPKTITGYYPALA
ncbi:hypothetical protein J6590_001967 [Homalodisca vitripennis]|nr:hypothetical protein J6590_001967 [Homalodisca vitripennis]